MRWKFLFTLTPVFLIAIACGPTSQNTSIGSTAKPLPEISSITWDQYAAIYGLKSTSTDLQKEQAWDRFKGKRVFWYGEVVEVSKGVFGGITIYFKMDDETLTSDVTLKLKSEYSEAASRLKKGERVHFLGVLRTYSGAIMSAGLDEGEL